MQPVRTAALLLLAALATGCGPIRSTMGLAKAQQAYVSARDAEAADHAPYLYTKAAAFHAKAREEQMASEYRLSEELALMAVELYDQARAVAVNETPLEDIDPEDLLEGADPLEEEPVDRRVRDEEPGESQEPEEPAERPTIWDDLDDLEEDDEADEIAPGAGR